MAEVARIAGRVGAYILSDEIYRGSELDGSECLSFHSVYDKPIILSGLRKQWRIRACASAGLPPISTS